MINIYWAVDIGASSGRHMLASMKDGKCIRRGTLLRME